MSERHGEDIKRRRNIIHKHMVDDRRYQLKVIPPKPKRIRNKLRPQDIDLAEDA